MRGRLFLLPAIPVVALTVVLAGSSAFAGEGDLKVGARVYFDYFVDLTDRDDSYEGAVSGFEFQRAYLTLKRSWGDVLFRYTTDIEYKQPTYVTDVAVDVDSTGGPAEVTTTSAGGVLDVYTKYAYLQWQGFIPGASILIGQHSPETHGWVDKRWRYRSMEKSLGNRMKWTNAAEVGIGLQGRAMERRLAYFLDFNNGTGYKRALSRNALGVAARLAYWPVEGVVVSGLFTSNNPGGQGKEEDIYLEGVAGYEGERFGIFGQFGQFTDGPSDKESTGVSGFGRVLLQDGLYALGRVDVVDPDTDTDDDGHTYLILGLDYQAHEGFYLQPSFRLMTYEASGTDDESEFRLTFYTEF